MNLLKALVTVSVIFASFSASAGFGDRRGGGRGQPGYGQPGRGGGYPQPGYGGSSACQDAIANVIYCQGQVQIYTGMVQNANTTCGADPYCRLQISQAWQYTVNQLQKAEQQRSRACN